MQEVKPESKLLHPIEIYSKYLATINNVSLTIREVEVLSCLVNGRNTKGIANFLSIAPKTVASHIYNAGNKFGCDTDAMIDLLAKSNQIPLLKEYYQALLTNTFFQEALKEIKKLISKADNLLEYRLIYWDKKPPFLENIQNDLSEAGLKVSLEGRKEPQSLDHLFLEVYHDMVQIYFVPSDCINPCEPPKNLPESYALSSRKIFFFSTFKTFPTFPEVLSQFTCIKPSEWSSYYASVFTLLKNILPNVDMTSIIKQFEEKASTFHTTVFQSAVSNNFLGNTQGREVPANTLKSHIPLMPKRLVYTLLATLSMLGLILFWAFKPDFLTNIISGHSDDMKNLDASRTDLEIPSDESLLERPQLITMMNEGLQKQAKGIKTLALIGTGGSGKTILARQYARLQNTSIVWEINAETRAFIVNSLLALSQSLCRTSEEKQDLMNLAKIQDYAEKKEKFFRFLKLQLKSHPNWILIYDNVENMRDIQKYFPIDDNGWGEGTVIITSQDNHIQNNGYIKQVVWVGELSAEEKLSLFRKIMNNGAKKNLASQNPQILEGFVEKLPSFPLDISTAAYYMKATDTNPDQYLDYLENYNSDFSEIQKNILAESTGSQKTRYHIITLALEKLVAADKNFGDLLLLISFLDSKNIPRFLLERYKGKLTVDHFVYALKKYSLMNRDNVKDSTVDASISIHQSIQEVGRLHLLKNFKMAEGQKVLAIMANVLENCMEDSINKEDYFNALLLLNHIKSFLKHSPHINDKIKQSLSCQLGGLYNFLGHFKRGQEILEENLNRLKRDPKRNYLQITKNLIYLGNSFRKLRQYDKAKVALEESLALLKTQLPQNHENMARASIYLGNVYRKLKDYEKARNFLEEGISFYENHRPKNNAAFARATSYLGAVYKELGLFDKAEPSLKQALAIYQTKFPQHYVGICWTLAYLGSLYKDSGSLDKSMDYWKKSMTMYKKCSPEDRTKIFWVFKKLGLIHTELQDHAENQIRFDKALGL